MKKKVLVVDDEAINASLMQEIMQRLGYEAEVFCEGKPGDNAIDRIWENKGKIFAVITDCEMPGTFGDKVVEAALESGIPAERIVVVSSKEANRSLADGAGHFIIKNNLIEQLETIAAQW